MKLKSLAIICVLLLGAGNLFAQEYAVDKGAYLISGTVSFSNMNGELFEDYNGDGVTAFQLAPKVNYFVAKNFFVGGGLDWSHQKQGDVKTNNIGFGPQFGYAFGDENSTAYPYLDAGLRYYGVKVDSGSSDSKASGTEIFFGAGIVVPVRSHIGITFEAGYHIMNLEDKDSDVSASGNIFGIGIGISGLLF
ncbi:porin family protein [Puteibacter caeruleilacunae]|nr:porin family protein [Puteibacter caeruleilacunae]